MRKIPSAVLAFCGFAFLAFPAFAAPCSSPSNGSCVGQTCSTLGQTIMDADNKNIIACLATVANKDCSANNCKWKAMSGGSGAVGSWCGEASWSIKNISRTLYFNPAAGAGTTSECTMTGQQAPCNGQSIMTTCGTTVCPDDSYFSVGFYSSSPESSRWCTPTTYCYSQTVYYYVSACVKKQ